MSDQAPPPEPTDPRIEVVGQLAKTSPGLGLLALVLTGGAGAGTIGSLFIAPEIDHALEDHVSNPYGHPELVRRLDKFEARMARVEDKLDDQADDMKAIKAGIDAALLRLQER